MDIEQEAINLVETAELRHYLENEDRLFRDLAPDLSDEQRDVLKFHYGLDVDWDGGPLLDLRSYIAGWRDRLD